MSLRVLQIFKLNSSVELKFIHLNKTIIIIYYYVFIILSLRLVKISIHESNVDYAQEPSCNIYYAHMSQLS